LKRIVTIVSLLVLLTILFSCALNPVTGRQELVLVGEQQEIGIGKKTDPEVLGRYGYYPDAVLQDYVRSIGELLARVSHRPSLAYHFKVVDSPSINAFALPGGYVYVTRGILAHLNSEAELSSVLGHEIGHVTERHAVQQMTASLGLQVVLLALSESLKGGEQFSQMTELLFKGILNGYGRKKEFSSDRLGQGYMVQAGYDPYAEVGVLTTLQRNSGNPLDPITHWLVSSHPYTSERIQRATAYAGELDPQKKVRLLNRDRYLRRIDGLIFGAGEREGVLEGQRYQNRYFRVSCNVPKGWKVRTGRDQWEAEAEDRNLRLQLRFEEFRNSLDPDGFAAGMEKRVGLKHPVIWLGSC
jgi:predicted Zn-dependent protease